MGLFNKRERQYYTLKDVPPRNEIHDGLLYDTERANLIAYSLENSDRNYQFYPPLVYHWGMEFIGLYRTANNRYYKYHYDNHWSIWGSLKPLDENEARKLYHGCSHKLIAMKIVEA